MEQHKISMDGRLWKDISILAESIGTTPSEIITSILIDWYARQDSYMESDGYVSRPLYEFIEADSITEKYQMLKAIYEQKHRQDWERQALLDAQNGIQLDDEQKKYIDNLQAKEGKRRSNRDRLRMYQEQGLCPSDYHGPAGLACRYIEQFKAGKMDRPQLDKILSRYKR